MKKICLIGLLAGMCGYVQANTINGPSSLVGTDSLLGVNAYEWGISSTTLASQANNAIYVPTGDTLQSVTITISGITLTSEATGTLWVDLLSSDISGKNGVKTGAKSFSDNDNGSDYFAKYSTADVLSVAKVGFTKNQKQNLSYTLTGTSLTFIEDSLLDYGYFDIGLDPDCYYDVNSLSFTYTVTPSNPNGTRTPDAATTVILLGAGLLGLEVFRRRFNLAPAK
jgi:hypothetical protein